MRDYAESSNLRQASARNVVGRTFGLLKKRFPILDTAPGHPISVQSWILPALCASHKYLRTHNDPVVEGSAVYEGNVAGFNQACSGVRQEDESVDVVSDGQQVGRESIMLTLTQWFLT